MADDVSDDELERRVREKWGTEAPARPVFETEQQRRMAEKLIGCDNIKRLQNRRPTAGRFRPTPVFVHYEFWWWNGSEYSMGFFRMERVENGRRTEHHYTGDIDKEVRRLKAAGFTVKRIMMGDEKTPAFAKKQTSDRQAIMARVGSIRI